MVPVVSVVGRSGAGKTTLLEQLIPALSGLGLRLAVIKHDVHGFDLDHPGKDTWRLRRAGADAVLISSPRGFALMASVDAEVDLEALVGLVAGRVDLVLTEGYRRGPFPKVEVVRQALGPPLCGAEDLVAVVTDAPLRLHCAEFRPDEVGALAAFLADFARRGGAGRSRGLRRHDPREDRPC